MPTDDPDEPAGAGERADDGPGDRDGAGDDRIVDPLVWLLDTETRARIYLFLRRHPDSTSREIAEGTGLYPSTVREALAALHGESTVRRTKRASGGAGNNPYEYEAIPPAELVEDAVDDVQAKLNTVFNLDRVLCGEAERGDAGPVTVSVNTSCADPDREPDEATADD
jgi:predicted transcriptional regulator